MSLNMEQKELFKLICTAEDDNGHICGNRMSRIEFDQDGMCSRCADGIWESMKHYEKSFIHEMKAKS